MVLSRPAKMQQALKKVLINIMTTKRKSEALLFLEKASGRPLSFAAMLESIRKGQEMSLNAFANILERSPSQFVRLALQDEMQRAGLKLKISVQNA